LSTIFSFINPSKAIFKPNYGGILLGIMTPGESIKNINGFCNILKPFTPFVVQTEA
jgi:hypothetical protein